MRTRLAVLVGLGVSVLLLALGFLQPRTYTASSVIYVEPMVSRGLNEAGSPGFDQFRYGSFLDQQMQTIVRPDVLTAALHTLPARTWSGPLEPEASAVARLAKALTVERELTSYQITVQLKASDPGKAAAIVNAVTNAYLQRGRDDEFKQSDQRKQILREERDRVKEELAIDRKEQAALGASMGLASAAEGAANPYDADLTNLRMQLEAARQARDVAAAQLESVSGQDAEHRSGLNASAEELINSDPGLSAKKAAVNARRVVLEGMMAGMTPNNPQYRQAQDEIADLDRSLEAKTAEVRAQTEQRIQDKLRTDLQRTAQVEAQINAQLAQATVKATGAGPKLQRAAELAGDIQRLSARYTAVDDALNALELETSGPGRAHVSLPAAVPASPDTDHRNLLLIAALPFGLLFGVSSAVVARMRDGRVYLGSDLQQAIGFPPLAVLPAREDVSSRVVDEYGLRLAAGVESAYRTAGARSFVLTAVSAGSAVGPLLANLARRLEDLRLRVLVIRASELLVTSAETMEYRAVQAASLASGGSSRPVRAGVGIIAAKLDRMKAQHDLILIDAAPLLQSAEAEYAARCADATILVAESAVTQTTELDAATALLSRLRVTGVAFVLANVKLEQADERFRSAVSAVDQSFQRVAGGNGTMRRKPATAGEAPRPHAPAPTGEAEISRNRAVAASDFDVVPKETERIDAQDAPAAGALTPDGSPRFVEVESAAFASHPPLKAAFGAAQAAPEADLANSAPVEHSEHEALTAQSGETSGQDTAISPDNLGVLQPRPEHAAPHASLGEWHLSPAVAENPIQQRTHEASDEEDAEALGRFIGEQEEIGVVPSHTRSKIRQAFKEQEVNSKTTWFSKLFRGDPPANFRISPDEDSPETIETQQSMGEQPPARLPEAEADDDPALAHLLARINTSGQTKIAPRPRSTVTAEAEPSLPTARNAPFVERRAEPRPIEIDEDQAPNEAPALLLSEENLPASELSPSTNPSHVLAAGSIAALALADGEFSAPPARSACETSHPSPAPDLVSPRPLRPLTFHQLAGSIEAEVLPEYPQPPTEPSTDMVADALPHFQAPELRTLWPVKEPILISRDRNPGASPVAPTLEPIFPLAPAGIVAIRAEVLAPSSSSPHAEQTSTQARPVDEPGLAAASPSARRSSMRRLTITSDPFSDPSPSQRSYRLETIAAARERTAAAEHATPEPVSTSSAAISFPPDQAVRQQMFGRRKTDRLSEASEVPGLTRPWKLLSQFEPVLSDPLPAHRPGYTRSTDRNRLRHDDRG
jgi:uncharacterized protein involved in exopolysaccharide biosynthesis